MSTIPSIMDQDEATAEMLGPIVQVTSYDPFAVRKPELQWKDIPVDPKQETNSVAIVSGGLDSITLVHHMLKEGLIPQMLSFDYGQRHKKEIVYARYAAQTLNLPHDTIDLSGITKLIGNSSLTSGNEVPEGHYAEDSMKATVVPNRNMMMLSIACAVAVNEKAQTIGIGVHGGDHFIYPDCRPEFIFAAGQAMLAGNKGFHNFNVEGADPIAYVPLTGPEKRFTPARPIYSPFLQWTKADIAYRALELGVPLHMTWSCYKGGLKHCGKCGTCVERLEAIDEASNRIKENSPGLRKFPVDYTEYEDTEFWRTAVHNAG